MFQGRDFSRLVAYPYEFVEPFGESVSRDDADALLPRLRILWDMLGDSTSSGIEKISKSITGSLYGNVNLLRVVYNSLMEKDFASKPTCRLIAPMTKSMDYRDLDALANNKMRETTISIRGSSSQTIMDYPLDMLPRPVIIMKFDMNKFKLVDGIKRNAEVEISRERITVVSFNGCKKQFTLDTIDDAVFATLFAREDIQYPRDMCLLPRAPNQVTFKMQHRFSEFWNYDLRAAPLVMACQPTDSASQRALCFTSVTLGTAKDEHGTDRVTLRGVLHQSASLCICPVHNMQPIHQRFPGKTFTGSNVTMTISMCGKRLKRVAANLDCASCPLHGAGDFVPSVPDLCCHGTFCEVSCAHFTSQRECKQGVSIRSIPLDDVNLLHAQLLVASAIRCSKSIGPILGKRNPEEIAKECDYHSDRLDHRLESIKRLKLCRPIKYTEEELNKMDKTSTDLLRAGKTAQNWVKSKRQTVLVTPNAKTGGLSSIGVEHEDLKHYHKWLFPRHVPRV